MALNMRLNVFLWWSICFFTLNPGMRQFASADVISSEALWDASGSRSSGNNVGVKVRY